MLNEDNIIENCEISYEQEYTKIILGEVAQKERWKIKYKRK